MLMLNRLFVNQIKVPNLYNILHSKNDCNRQTKLASVFSNHLIRCSILRLDFHVKQTNSKENLLINIFDILRIIQNFIYKFFI